MSDEVANMYRFKIEYVEEVRDEYSSLTSTAAGIIKADSIIDALEQLEDWYGQVRDVMSLYELTDIIEDDTLEELTKEE